MKTIKLTNTEKTLLAAADYIEEHGWCQNRPVSGGRVCALQALHSVKVTGVYDAVLELERRIGSAIVSWNDDPSRTKEQVISTMRAVTR